MNGLTAEIDRLKIVNEETSFTNPKDKGHGSPEKNQGNPRRAELMRCRRTRTIWSVHPPRSKRRGEKAGWVQNSAGSMGTSNTDSSGNKEPSDAVGKIKGGGSVKETLTDIMMRPPTYITCPKRMRVITVEHEIVEDSTSFLGGEKGEAPWTELNVHFQKKEKPKFGVHGMQTRNNQLRCMGRRYDRRRLGCVDASGRRRPAIRYCGLEAKRWDNSPGKSKKSPGIFSRLIDREPLKIKNIHIALTSHETGDGLLRHKLGGEC
ncbi:hypothetical protein C8F04DRAFT_1202036 [Mycena alexandri]|uniref:Uncharacterized protein n=1 Tax=Mycena alexandri TaxID=1745969 RepID=A0AAD6WPT9_9AGAR|nr:hypothetical protein C8F04DRAFT_1202036 [Mycena alexandri]